MILNVFPAHAGMSRWGSNTGPCDTRIPRNRGVLHHGPAACARQNKSG